MAVMVITCESCGAKFRLDSDKLNKPRNKVRCSKCKNIFVVEQPDEDGLIHIEISDEESVFIPGTVPEQIAKPAVSKAKKEWLSNKKILFAAVACLLILIALGLVFGPGRSLLTSGKNLSQGACPAYCNDYGQCSGLLPGKRSLRTGACNRGGGAQ